MTSFMHLRLADPAAELGRHIGYWKPYATGHADLDADTDLQEEVRNAARAAMERPCRSTPAGNVRAVAN